jgi:hypothetical protein
MGVTLADLTAIVSRYDGVTDFINNASDEEKLIVLEGVLRIIERDQTNND